MEDILQSLQNAIFDGNKSNSESLTRQALSSGIPPLKIISDGLQPSLLRIGDAFESNEIFLPELVCSGEASLTVSNVVEQALSSGEKIPTKGSIAIGTVKGDIHSIGKSLVTTMMKVNGFKVLDLGVDVSPEEFLDAAGDVQAVGLSGLLSLSTRAMEETIKQVSAKFPNVLIIIGGAAVDPALAKAFGVLYGPDAASAPRIVEANLKPASKGG